MKMKCFCFISLFVCMFQVELPVQSIDPCASIQQRVFQIRSEAFCQFSEAQVILHNILWKYSGPWSGCIQRPRTYVSYYHDYLTKMNTGNIKSGLNNWDNAMQMIDSYLRCVAIRPECLTCANDIIRLRDAATAAHQKGLQKLHEAITLQNNCAEFIRRSAGTSNAKPSENRMKPLAKKACGC